MKVEEKCIHSKIHKDNSSIYKTQITTCWTGAPKTTFTHQCPAINFIIRLLLSGVCRSLLPDPHYLICWLILLPTCHQTVVVWRLSAFKSTSLAICVSVSFLSSPTLPPILLFSLMPALSPFHGQTCWKWREAPDFKVSMLPLHSIHPSNYLSIHLSGSVSKQSSKPSGEPDITTIYTELLSI